MGSAIAISKVPVSPTMSFASFIMGDRQPGSKLCHLQASSKLREGFDCINPGYCVYKSKDERPFCLLSPKAASETILKQ
ncbi:MAG: hypothetical protein M1530_01265 [Candidatus Marsarchaeota archaeon]|nr:hypothetical protein [Candidatus Marsarchaeota archaeon]